MKISFLGRFFTSCTNVVIDVFILVFLFNIIGCSTQKKIMRLFGVKIIRQKDLLIKR